LKSIEKSDSIALILQPDCCHDLNPAMIIKDSAAKKMIRYFPGTDKIAVKDILRYVTKENNRVWLLYTHKEPEKVGTVLWDLNDTYPRRGGSPRLYLTILE
jgi:hypothetical protein